MSYQLSKKEMMKEILQCGKDPVYFLNNYARITHPIHGSIPFRTFDFQTDLLKDFNDYRYNIILKARQLGISTICAGYISWLLLFHRDKNVLVMATKFGTATNLVKKVKQIIKSTPEFLRISHITVDNKSSFELSNGSQIKATSTSSDAGRSEVLSLLVLDEAAHIDDLDTLWTGLFPTISTGGRCIALSTPNGVGNWFHQTYIDSIEDRNDFKATTLPWDRHPERDQVWFENETRNLSKRKIAQEYECNFNASGETVIHPTDIEKIEKRERREYHKTGYDRNLYIWESYSPENSYIVSADVARGDGKDYSVFHVININTMEQVAEYQGKPDIDLFATILNDVGRQYGNCLLVVENNNIGYSVLTKLKEMNYPNLYYSIKGANTFVESYQAETMSNAVLGFTTSMKTRPLIIAKLEEFVRNELLIINSDRLLNEIKTFIWMNGRPEAQKGYNDDLIMSLAIACWVRDTAIMASQRDMEYKEAFLNSMTKSGTTLNTAIPGMIGYDKKQDFEKKKKEYQQFSWLFKG